MTGILLELKKLFKNASAVAVALFPRVAVKDRKATFATQEMFSHNVPADRARELIEFLMM